MAQNYTIDCFAVSNVGLTDLQNMENNFECIRTLFSGSSAPSNTTSGVPWFDTAKKILKIRDSTNGAWLGILQATTAPRFWVYANSAGDGWVVDSSVTDRVIAIKGGSLAYNANGGTLGGAWVDFTHNHLWYNSQGGGADDQSYNSTGAAVDFNDATANIGFFGWPQSAVSPGVDYYTNNYSNASFRPAAAIGTMQYLNI